MLLNYDLSQKTEPFKTEHNIDSELKMKFFRQMLLIRRFEERAAQMYGRQKISGFCHLYIGQEAVGTGAINAIEKGDYVISHYRDHAQAILRGASPKAVMAELFGKATGISKGKGGSMHLFDKEHNFLGGHGIVGGQIPLATGVGFAIKYRRENKICLCFLGDAAINQGSFHESLNMAAIWNLPVIYIVENNKYGMGTDISRTCSLENLSEKGCSYNIPFMQVDGMDVKKIYSTCKAAVETVRTQKTPVLIEAMTYRFKGHSMADAATYRTKDELEEYKKLDPVLLLKEELIKEGSLSEDEIKKIEKEIKTECDEAVSFADESPEPDLSSLYEDVYADMH